MTRHSPILKLIAGATLAAMLSGCSLVRLPIFGHRAAAKPTGLVTAPLPTGDADTQEGRRLLATGQPGAAIEILQRALGRGEPVGPALNALGVSYARIGRLDLAERYLTEAASLDPANSQYANNLVIVLRARDARAREVQLAREREAVLAAARMPPPPRPLPGRLQRVSSLEVKIITAPAQTAPLYRAAAGADAVAPTATTARTVGIRPRLAVKIITAPAPVAPRGGSTPAARSDRAILASVTTRRVTEQVR